MTHRSRSFAPASHRPQSKKKRGPKLHHPPSQNAPKRVESEDESDAEAQEQAEEDDEDTAVPPASAFEHPTDLEMLNILRSALHAAVHSVDFAANVQKAKALLYERKWLELFTDPALLDAYAGRWVPSRAMAFRALMAELRDVRALFVDGIGSGAESDEEEEDQDGEVQDETEDDNAEASTAETSAETPEESKAGSTSAKPAKQILSIGGGAGSELLAVAALSAAAPGARVHWTGVDIGDWSSVVSRIDAAANDVWKLGATFEFIECDVLATPAKAGSESKGSAPSPTTAGGPPPFLAPLPAPDLTTIFFTLTELLSQSRARTLALLRALTARTPVGGHMLVVDSASDIAQFPLGKDGRTWPVYMVLDALVLKAIGGWEKVRAEDSRWFRVEEETAAAARWPCKLENARYWLRLYRRV
jgi:25S rRNA (uracil2843-N3)-methyltransferase